MPSKVCALRIATELELQRLKAEPELLESFFLLDHPKEEPGATWLRAPSEQDVLDLGMAWDALHFLLSRGEAPIRHLKSRGTPLTDETRHVFGPVHALSCPEVAEFSRALEAVSPDQLRRRFDPEAMREVYPGNGYWGAHDDHLPSLLEDFERLRAIVRRAARAGQALVVCYAYL